MRAAAIFADIKPKYLKRLSAGKQRHIRLFAFAPDLTQSPTTTVLYNKTSQAAPAVSR
jgi:hypothetical protein